MGKRLTLRMRIHLLVAALVLLALAGGSTMIGYTYRIEDQLNHIVEQDIAAYQLAESLESALVNQKGFVSYYFLDGNPDWLRQLGEYRQIFRERLEEARKAASTEGQRNALAEIAAGYDEYIRVKNEVIAHYRSGEREKGVQIHSRARQLFFQILKACEDYREQHRMQIEEARERTRHQAARLRRIAAAAMALVSVLGILLSFVLAVQVLAPVRKLAIAADRSGEAGKNGDIVKALGRSVEELMQDIHQTTSKLERSRENLLQAEKLALVGKLAAGMAHSIRNPFTSVKMRLFSLSRTLEMDDTQREDFDVISEEIRHIDTIVQNFLEFSRPPRYQFQSVSPSAVVDAAVQLLEHRLKTYDVEVHVDRERILPAVQADPEQLKEVVVNLMVNACEAMDEGGRIVVEERVERKGDRTVAVVRVCDNGPGIADALLEKVLQPFYTTKEEGTGLGLAIAQRIVAEHGGRLEVASREGEGACFSFYLPVKED
ncbi:MAG: MCP four helix bundle domain-containing protein [Desulfobacteraceae bacterium]|nr:MCP four helix bundle domain-containing protein [Desulfobacteraceae bacterium]